MANYNKSLSPTAVRLGEVRFSYAYLFSPRANDDGTEKYSTQILIPKSDTMAKKLIDDAVEVAKKNGVSTKWNGKMPVASKLKLPLRDGDEEYPGDPLYEGHWFMNASTSVEHKPGVAILENGQVVQALDGDDFYSGCYGCVTLNFFPYAAKGSNGVAAGLNNVIKTRDGEKLAGGHSAEQDFADLLGDASFLD